MEQGQDFEAKIADLLRLKKRWDSYDAEPPNQLAASKSREMLEALRTEKVPIIGLGAASDGGIFILVSNGSNSSAGDKRYYADVECFNDGDILACFDARPPDSKVSPEVWRVGDIREGAKHLKAYIDGQST